MRFLLDAEQQAFARSLDALLTAADTPAVVRAWSTGDHAPGRALWSRLADMGVFALAVPETYEGVGPLPVDLAVAFVELGRHGVPGPLVETVAAAALLTGLGGPDGSGPAKRLLPPLAAGGTVVTLALPGGGPYVLDGDAADVELTVTGGGEHAELHLAQGREPARQRERAGKPEQARDQVRAEAREQAGARASVRTPAPPALPAPQAPKAPQALQAPQAPQAPVALPAPPAPSAPPDRPAPRPAPRPSLDPARRLTLPHPGRELLAIGAPVDRAAARALIWARLATAAQALGVGLALLDRTVAYVRRRTQFGVPVGSFQAVKHRLADAKIALEFARPLLFGAALTMTSADVAAAKVAACEAAYATARSALQLHGAIGYTAEYDLSLWLTKARALRTAWGSPAECRAAVLGGDARRW